jgi:hypothetical protein
MSDPYSAQDAVLAYLLTTFGTATTKPVDDGYVLQSEGTGSGIRVRVIVGGDGTGEPGDPSLAASSAQRPVAFEDDPADEAGSVQCAIIADSGDDGPTALATLREATLPILAALEAAVRADRTLGGAVANAWISEVQLVQSRVRGSELRRPFTVTYEALQG